MDYSYASVTDVEKRLGSVLDENRAQSLQIFLEDTSAYITALFEEAGVTLNLSKEAGARRVVAQRGAQYILNGDLPNGLKSRTESVGDTSKSETYIENDPNYISPLTAQEKILLGLRHSKITNISLTPARRFY